jgi:hypothetical protein
MRNTIFTLLLLLGTQTAVAATVTARATATILEPVKVSFQTEHHEYASINGGTDLNVESARDLHYELSRKSGDLCLVKGQQEHTGENKLALANCETYTISFN